ncbi:hypothetical protein ACK6D9_04450 [Hoeflea sp. Naph1]|uniref:hypothetical protein n=1 Tax=Hoeflea sp. Naph1 TaxID=3388653 RepID=UPI00398FB0CC
MSRVALYAVNAPFHPETPEMLVLSHAEYFSADSLMMLLNENFFLLDMGKRIGRKDSIKESSYCWQYC